MTPRSAASNLSDAGLLDHHRVLTAALHGLDGPATSITLESLDLDAVAARADAKTMQVRSILRVSGGTAFEWEHRRGEIEKQMVKRGLELPGAEQQPAEPEPEPTEQPATAAETEHRCWVPSPITLNTLYACATPEERERLTRLLTDLEIAVRELYARAEAARQESTAARLRELEAEAARLRDLAERPMVDEPYLTQA